MEHAKLIKNSGIYLVKPTSSLVKKKNLTKVTFQIGQTFLIMFITRQLNKKNKQERMIKLIEFETGRIKTKSNKILNSFKSKYLVTPLVILK